MGVFVRAEGHSSLQRFELAAPPRVRWIRVPMFLINSRPTIHSCRMIVDTISDSRFPVCL